VQFARGGNRPRDDYGHAPRMAPRPRRTVHRMTITGLPYETSWQVSNSLPSLSWP
jgi:transcription initiation factor TFIID subunit 15